MFAAWKSIRYALLTAIVLSACQTDQDVAPSNATDCLVQATSTNGQAIAGQYIVTLTTTPDVAASPNARVAAVGQQFLLSHQVDDPAVEMVSSAGEHTTFVAHLNELEADNLRRDPAVLSIEPDREVSICNCVDLAAPTTLTWNIRQTGYGRGDVQTGKTVWIIDTGIDQNHPDLNVDTGRSRSFLTSDTSPDDLNGHGTHVAGIIGALNNNIGVTGVASGARLVGLKVLSQLGSGRLSGVIAAVNHVIQNGKAGDVVNMSLGGEGSSPTLERAVRQAANAGILFAIAAGNDGESAENQSPANVNHPNVFTVGAISQTDQTASFSNYGPSVDVMAYGVRIRSTYSDGRYATLSGTSMAAPHVAGLLYIRGNKLPTRGTALDSRDGRSVPIARQ